MDEHSGNHDDDDASSDAADTETGAASMDAQWDDALLVKAWDAAMRDYRAQHGDRDWKTHTAEQPEAVHKTHDNGGAGKRARDEGEDARGDDDADAATRSKRARTDGAAHTRPEQLEAMHKEHDTVEMHAAPLPMPRSAGACSLPAPSRAARSPCAVDAALTQLLHAWYWAGYYAAVYETTRTHDA